MFFCKLAYAILSPAPRPSLVFFLVSVTVAAITTGTLMRDPRVAQGVMERSVPELRATTRITMHRSALESIIKYDRPRPMCTVMGFRFLFSNRSAVSALRLAGSFARRRMVTWASTAHAVLSSGIGAGSCEIPCTRTTHLASFHRTHGDEDTDPWAPPVLAILQQQGAAWLWTICCDSARPIPESLDVVVKKETNRLLVLYRSRFSGQVDGLDIKPPSG